jgi:uncharacterized protein (DUF427 family)
VASAVATRGERVHVEHGAKRIRGYLGGDLVVDSIRPLLVWESPRYPTYYFPADDVRAELRRRGDEIKHSPSRGDAEVCDVVSAHASAAGAALRYPSSPVEEISGLIRFEWAALDAWFEEDEQMFTHARNPYTRVDILQSSRHVRIEVEGMMVAESSAPRLLFETGVPVRYYLPKTHARMELLVPSDKVSHCPYKGQAEYWSVRVGDRLHENLVWSYRTPLPESVKIAGLLCFWNDRVDLQVDGSPQ